MDTIYQFTNIDAIIFMVGLTIMTYLLRNEYGKITSEGQSGGVPVLP